MHREDAFFKGIVKIREVPFSEEEYKLYWKKLPESMKDEFTVAEYYNILTLNGFSQILSYIGSGNAVTLGFSQYFSVGNASIVSVQSSDSGVAGEYFRKAPTSTTIVGNQITISTYFSTSEGNGSITNAGLYGVSATGTLGSGTLMTHTLYTYTKANTTAISNDYLIVLQ